MNNSPIGIFDSGIGGLTLAKSLLHALPKERIVYYGDTIHFPYGNKTPEQIQNYALHIADFLLEHHCKLIAIACHSASSTAYDVLQEHLHGKALLVDIINPTIDYIVTHYAGKTIGLIGTQRTIDSQIYNEKLAQQAPDITLHPVATPDLATAIETNIHDHAHIDDLLSRYLSQLPTIDALILGCTHYPIIRDRIASHFHYPADLIDSADITTQTIQQLLAAHDVRNTQGTGEHLFFLSQYAQKFHDNASLFFDTSIKLDTP